MRNRKKFKHALVALAVLVAAVVVAGCGGGGHGSGHRSGHGGSSGADANGVDRAFVRLMVPHHQSAVEMAEIAQGRASHGEITTLARDIASSQNAEIDQMTGIAKAIGTEVPGSSGTSGMDHGGGHAMGDAGDLKELGLSEAEAGMAMDAGRLEDAKPFDRAFIDMMVPHHEGAIRMAKAELARGENPELKTLAEKIVSAQEKEIAEMNSWRTDWYGGPPPGSG